MSGNRLTIFDTTLRDGEQAPGFSLRIDEKLKLARQLARSAWTSSRPGSRSRRRPTPRRSAWSRRTSSGRSSPRWRAAIAQDIERAGLGARRRRRAGAIHTFIATSDLHLERKLRMTREECLATAMAAVRLARSYTDDVEFSAEDATRSDLDFLCRVVEAVIKAGATTINLPDTVGYSTPDEIARVLPHGASTRVPNSDQVDVQRALPRRSRPGRRQHAGGASAPARGRSSARSTASASAPATRRSKRS